MTHPNSRTRSRARNARASPKLYRLTPAGFAWLEQRAPAGAIVSSCVYCGCTDERACPGGCSWAIVDLDARRGVCTSCVGRPLAEIHTNAEIATKNRRALAQLRTLNNALIAAGLPPAPGTGNK